MFSPNQFTHILPLSIWCITTARYYFHETTFITRNQKCDEKICQRYIWAQVTRNNLVLVLATWCLWWGWRCQGANRDVGGAGGILGLHMKTKSVYCKELMKTQDGLLQTIEHELRSMGHKFVPLLATRCLYWGYIWLKVSLTQRLNKCQDDLTSYWAQVNCTYVSTTVGHQMPLLGDTSDWMSAWSKG